MILIAHKINSISKLKLIPKSYGVEIDLRSYKNEIILNHEPFKNGEKFTKFLKFYKHKLLVLNIKESGIENKIIKILKKKKIKKYFLLDVEFPYFWFAKENNIRKLAIRFSEDEPIENYERLKKNFDWVWIDTKTSLPLNKKVFNKLKKLKMCLVCPERWGRPEDIKKYKRYFEKNNIYLDAVMANWKYFDEWEK